MTAFTRNLVTDDGLTSGGTEATNDAAFDSWLAWAQAKSASDTIAATISAGTYATGHSSPFGYIRAALTINATGATINPTFQGFRLTGFSGFDQVGSGSSSALVDTVARGAASLRCLSASQASNFQQGDWCGLGALEWQGSSGYPPNHHYFQFVQILTADSSTGIVTFTPAATQNYFKYYADTHDTGAAYLTGGPATLFRMGNANGTREFGWNIDYTINGLTIRNLAGASRNQFYAPGRRVILNDLTSVDCAISPTTNQFIQMNRMTTTGDAPIEVDKECEGVEFNSCNLVNATVQSSSVQSLILDATTISNFLHGTAKRTIIRNGCNIASIKYGAQGYGTSETFVSTDSVISNVETPNIQQSGISNFTNSNGDLAYIGSGVLPFGAPNSLLFIGGSNVPNVGPSAMCRDNVATPATPPNEPLLETEFGAFPTPPGGVTYYVSQHPCPDVSVSDCTGCPAIIDLSSAPKNKPFFSYCLRTDNFVTQPTIIQWGEVTYVRAKVTRAYTGVLSSLIFYPYRPVDFGFFPSVNAKIVGERIITVSSTTGQQSGDSLPLPVGFWVNDSLAPALGADISGEDSSKWPIIELEFITDQGFDPRQISVPETASITPQIIPGPAGAPLRRRVQYENYDTIARREKIQEIEALKAAVLARGEVAPRLAEKAQEFVPYRDTMSITALVAELARVQQELEDDEDMIVLALLH